MVQRHSTPTVESIKQGLVKLTLSLSRLAAEVSGVRTNLGKFAKGRKLRPQVFYTGFDYHQRPETEEPKSSILEQLKSIGDSSNLQIADRILLAIANDAEGAFRDIRAIRADIEAIRDDSDLRAEFKSWRQNNT